MFQTSAYQLDSRQYIISCWDDTKPECLNTLVTTKNVEEVKKILQDTFGGQCLSMVAVVDSWMKINPSQMSEYIPGIHQMVVHPVSKNPAQLKSVIMSLNDEHQWTREQIADWLDTLDNQPKFGA